MELIAEHLGSDITTLSDYESYYQEGDKGELKLYLDRMLYQDEIKQLEYELCNQGVMLTAPITQDARILVIKFQKAIAPLLIIGGAIAVLVVGIVGWQLLKTSVSNIPVWTWLLGGAVIYHIIRRKKWLGKQ